jgi:hypothetical protein
MPTEVRVGDGRSVPRGPRRGPPAGVTHPADVIARQCPGVEHGTASSHSTPARRCAAGAAISTDEEGRHASQARRASHFRCSTTGWPTLRRELAVAGYLQCTRTARSGSTSRSGTTRGCLPRRRPRGLRPRRAARLRTPRAGGVGCPAGALAPPLAREPALRPAAGRCSCAPARALGPEPGTPLGQALLLVLGQRARSCAPPSVCAVEHHPECSRAAAAPYRRKQLLCRRPGPAARSRGPGPAPRIARGASHRRAPGAGASRADSWATSHGGGRAIAGAPRWPPGCGAPRRASLAERTWFRPGPWEPSRLAARTCLRCSEHFSRTDAAACVLASRGEDGGPRAWVRLPRARVRVCARRHAAAADFF